MPIPNPHIRFTYDDYQTLPESMAGRYELLDGDITMVPSPTTSHQAVCRNLAFLLLAYTRNHHWGVVLTAPLDVVLGEGQAREVVQPDLLFIVMARRHIITRKEIAGAPDLVVEVLSPGTEGRDHGYKRALYGRYGVREYWVLDPDDATIEVYRQQPEGFVLTHRFGRADTLRSDLFPGLEIPLTEVFEQEW